MQTITFECEVITPMFLAGADGTTPELRPPSIKGALRFWWRAMNGADSVSKLKEEESALFGSPNENVGKSKVIICYPKISNTAKVKISMTPHHREGYCDINNTNKTHCQEDKNMKGICSKSKERQALIGEFTFDILYNEQKINKDLIVDLFKSAFLLGGLGKRSRRGFGSIKILKIDGQDVFRDIQEIEKFIDAKITKPISDLKYPYIKCIEFGQSQSNYKDLLIKIGEASHDNSCYHIGKVGKINGQNIRFASPVYVSVIKLAKNDYRPIITTLHKEFEDVIQKEVLKKDIQDKTEHFKRAIL